MSDAAAPSRENRSAVRPRLRRVTRVIRDIDVWSVFKVGLVFHLVLFVITLIAVTLLWGVANSTGTIDNVENFFESFGWETFSFDGASLFGNFAVFGLLAGQLLGPGVAWASVLAAAASANLVNAYVQPELHASVGASTESLTSLPAVSMASNLNVGIAHSFVLSA